MIEKFNFTGRAKGIFIGASILGIILIIIGALATNAPASRFWTNYMLCCFYFGAISVTAVAWIAINYAAKAGWAVSIKRISEAIAGYLPVAFVGFLVLILCSLLPGHKHGLYAIYKWMHTELPSIANDKILAGKRSYLGFAPLAIRTIVILIIWIIFQQRFRKLSLMEDNDRKLQYFDKATYSAAAFLPLYGVLFCLFGFDWLMSTEPKWYSTIYSVNIFASALVGMLSLTVLIAVLLKKNDYMPYVNDNHFHDLGKFMFGFSIFWCYTWVAQFLLIWYANIPEESIYYLRRMHGNWNILFFANFTINFIVPFLGLMMRNSKRKYNYLVGIAVILLIGRYIDWYLNSMVGAVGPDSGFGFYEIGFFLLFGGVFAYTVCYHLSKANLVPINHPYLEESLHHEI